MAKTRYLVQKNIILNHSKKGGFSKMPRAPKPLARLSVSDFVVRRSTKNNPNKIIIDIDDGLRSSDLIIKNFMVSVKSITLNKIRGFGVLIETRLVRRFMGASVLEIEETPTVSVIEKFGEWNLVIVDGRLIVQPFNHEEL